MGFVKIENTGIRMFEQFPLFKRACKRAYQLANCALAIEKIKSEGAVKRVTPDDGYEYFYGYYDKSPWDAIDRYMIALRVKQAYKSVAPKEEGILVLIDTANDNKVYKIATVHSWNVQQGCMAQWMGPDFKNRIIYNDFKDGKYCSIIYNLKIKNVEKVLAFPVYDIAKDGSFALSLDFSRLHRMRPGYGYSNLPEITKGNLCPDKPCIWKIDLVSGEVSELFKYTDIAGFEPYESMKGAEHKVNHLMISPNGKRFMVLHRWFQKGRKHTRLITVNVDKTEMYNLSDDVFVSHCYWKNDDKILSFLRKKETGNHYYLMKDKTREYQMYWPELNTDGHCSYSPDSNLIITDTYPNRKRLASVYLCTDEGIQGSKERIARVFSPFHYDNDCRCDLHPRWNRKGDKICIDSVHEGKRALYTIKLDLMKDTVKTHNTSPMASVIVPCYNTATTVPTTLKSLEQQTYKNFEIIIIDDGSKDNIETVVLDAKRNTGLNIVFVRQENGGVASARNHGIELARGKYLCFLDGDDVYHPQFLEQSIGVCEMFNTDTMLSYQNRNINETLSGIGIETLCPKVSDICEFMEHFMYNKDNIHFGGLLYRCDIVLKNQLNFSVGTKYGEDLEFAWKYLTNCRNGVILKSKMYGYLNNPNSAINTICWEKTNLVDAMLRVTNYMKTRNHSFSQAFSNYMLPRTVWTTAKTFAAGKRKDYYIEFIKKFPVKESMYKLIKHARNKSLKISAAMFCVSKAAFYTVIGIVYKNRYL